MHPTSLFHLSDARTLEVLVAERGFALIVGADGDRPLVAQAPVLLSEGRLRFHLSRANRLCSWLAGGGRALAVLGGPDAYVSPDWYVEADQVPTWNYVSVEVEGPARRLDVAATIRLLDDLSAYFEARLAPKPPWTRAKMDSARFEAMLAGIVGFELAVDRLEGIAKLSQNKPLADRARLAQALAEQPDASSRAIGALIAAEAVSSREDSLEP